MVEGLNQRVEVLVPGAEERVDLVWGSGFRVQVWGFVRGLGFGVWGLGFGVPGSGFRVQGLGSRV